MRKEKIEHLISNGYEVDIEKSFKRGWEMFKVYPLYSMAYCALIFSIQFIFAIYLSDVAILFSVFLAGPLYAGFFLVANKISRDEKVIYPDFFGGFQYYTPVMLVWVVGQVVIVFGILFLVLPGIYLLVGYMFALLIAIFGGMDFWRALEYSRKIIHVKWWQFLFLLLLLTVLNTIGALFLLVGLFVTVPLTFYTLYCLFEEIAQDALATED